MHRACSRDRDRAESCGNAAEHQVELEDLPDADCLAPRLRLESDASNRHVVLTRHEASQYEEAAIGCDVGALGAVGDVGGGDRRADGGCAVRCGDESANAAGGGLCVGQTGAELEGDGVDGD